MAQAVWMNIEPLSVLERVEQDAAWVKLLPQGSVITSTKGHGASYWSRTARIDVRLPTGEEQAYFLKLATPNGGLMMCHGEWESMCALYAVSPEFIPKPIGYGTFEADPEQHFFLCEFIDLDDELPHVVEFCESLADLHRRSTAMAPQLKNPDNMFGFHVVTCNGTVPTNLTWKNSWETWYMENMKHLFAWEEKLQGPSEKIQGLLPTLYEKVIPRLLRPLETDGRTLNPCLLHGDLWDGNTAVHAKTDKPYIFDASSFWGHNECDLAKWRGSRYRMRRMYVKEYFRHFPISPPEEDCDDRSLLYSLRADLHDSILFPTTTRFRELLIVTLQKLAEKFPNGYEGTAPPKSQDTDVENAPQQQDPAVNHEEAENGWASHTPTPPHGLPDRTLPQTEAIHPDSTAEEHSPLRPIGGNINEVGTNQHIPDIASKLNATPLDTEDGMDSAQNRIEVGSEIGVGESAISPPAGSVVNS